MHSDPKLLANLSSYYSLTSRLLYDSLRESWLENKSFPIRLDYRIDLFGVTSFDRIGEFLVVLTLFLFLLKIFCSSFWSVIMANTGRFMEFLRVRLSGFYFFFWKNFSTPFAICWDLLISYEMIVRSILLFLTWIRPV